MAPATWHDVDDHISKQCGVNQRIYISRIQCQVSALSGLTASNWHTTHLAAPLQRPVKARRSLTIYSSSAQNIGICACTTVYELLAPSRDESRELAT